MSLIRHYPVGMGDNGFSHNLYNRSGLFDGATGYLSKSLTGGTSNDHKTWTVAAWLKLGNLSGSEYVFARTVNGFNDRAGIYINAPTGDLYYQNRVGNSPAQSLQAPIGLTDPTSWFHLVVRVDTTQATEADRIRMYVNGIQLTGFSAATYPAQDALMYIGGDDAHYIGALNNTPYQPWSGYMADFHYVSGQSLGPEAFGSVDPKTGWFVAGNVGALDGGRGAYVLDPASPPSDWAKSGAITSSQDSPSNNRPVLNPATSLHDFSAGNLRATVSGSSDHFVLGSLAVSTGRYFYTVTVHSSAHAEYVGWADVGRVKPTASSEAFRAGSGVYAMPTGINNQYREDGGAGASQSESSVGGGNSLAVAIDLDVGNIWYGTITGGAVTWWGGGDPVTGANPGSSFTPGGRFKPFLEMRNAASDVTFAFTEADWAAPVPKGFKALCTAHMPKVGLLPKGQIAQGSYDGNGTNLQVTGLGFPPGLLFIKKDQPSSSWQVVDSLRGPGKELDSSSTAAETTHGELVSFDADGFTLTHAGGYLNANGVTHHFLALKFGPVCQAVTYTGDGAASQTVHHPLGDIPALVIVKPRNGIGSWYCWTNNIGMSLAAGHYLALDLPNGLFTDGLNIHGGQAPTVEAVEIFAPLNQAGVDYLMIVMPNVPGLLDIRARTGAGVPQFAYKGGRPLVEIIKGTNFSFDWHMWTDAMNPDGKWVNKVEPNTTEAVTALATSEHYPHTTGAYLKGTSGAHNGNTSSDYLDIVFLTGPPGGANIPPALAGPVPVSTIVTS
ncbi:DUF7483 domain-containing protein [Aestuariispira insulae]|uniref:Concanavalin A-like lectin/glucanase superfamily protein n=1 Tax=Aestuariispira insulae TaxID=1461337 RepID=A0A3D9HRR1_9PROT|nr:LamG-like jellyroll fold domain-containing protein [Aestuariispira insulae]RED52188.1 concanavalin A-like lectin/glucanase superfamily protein [Aestuariispira insulae]